MPFIYERISPKDKQKLCTTGTSDFYRAGEDHWAIDHQSDSFLILRARFGMEGPSDEAFWAFFWEGQLFDVHVKNEQIEQDADGNIIEERKILSIGNLHKCARDDRRQFAEDLTDAFTASCRGALVIPYSTYELLLAFPVL